MPQLYVGGTGTLTGYEFSASGPVRPGPKTEKNDTAKHHEGSGEILDGVDIWDFSGVPTGFDGDHPWSLDLYLNLGTGWVEFVPTFLNAVDVEIRSEGAHYMLVISEPGMILRGSKADKPDQVTTQPNTVFNGNVRGGKDSVRVWPPVGLQGVADNPAQYRVEDGEWQYMAVVSPSMGV